MSYGFKIHKAELAEIRDDDFDDGGGGGGGSVFDHVEDDRKKR